MSRCILKKEKEKYYFPRVRGIRKSKQKKKRKTKYINKKKKNYELTI